MPGSFTIVSPAPHCTKKVLSGVVESVQCHRRDATRFGKKEHSFQGTQGEKIRSDGAEVVARLQKRRHRAGVARVVGLDYAGGEGKDRAGGLGGLWEVLAEEQKGSWKTHRGTRESDRGARA